jgi:hypothetical protein
MLITIVVANDARNPLHFLFVLYKQTPPHCIANHAYQGAIAKLIWIPGKSLV